MYGLCDSLQTSVVGHFKWDSRHAWLHGRNRKITSQKDTNPKNSPELFTKKGFHRFTPNQWNTPADGFTELPYCMSPELRM